MPTKLKCDDLATGGYSSEVMDIDKDKLTVKAEPMTVKAEPITLHFGTEFNRKAFMRIMGFDVIVYPKKIIRSGDCTIVFWDDDTKTIVRKSADVSDDSLYTAFTAALAIKIYGSNSRLKKLIKEAYVEQKPKKGRKHGNESDEADSSEG